MTSAGSTALRGGISLQRLAQLERAIAIAGDLEFDAEEIHGRGDDEEARHRGRHDDVAEAALADQHVVAGGDAALAVDAEAGRGIALRIEIDDEDALADRRERRAEVDRGRRLADAALLIRHDKDARLAARRTVPNQAAGSRPWADSRFSADSKYCGPGVDRAGKNFDRIGSVKVKRLELIFRGPASGKHSSRSLFQPHCGQFESQRQGGEGPRRHGVHRSELRRRRRTRRVGDESGLRRRSRAPLRVRKRICAGRSRCNERLRRALRRAEWR